MPIVLKTNIHVNERGKAFVPYEILKDYINSSLKKIPFEFNDAQNKIQIHAGMNEKYIERYESNTTIKNRKFLYFKITESRIKDQNKSRAFFETIKNKLETPESPTKLEEIIKNIKDLYEKRKIFCFYFNRSNYLKKFVNEVFDIELIEPIDGSLPKKVVFNFKNIDDITPRSINTSIHQGTLLIHKDGPPKVVKHFMDKDYVVMKLFSLMENHSDNFKDVYDILITCNEEIVNQIFQSKDFINPNVFSGVYTNKSQNFYISKLKFKNFLKSSGKKFLYINNALTNDIIEIPFDDKIYEQFLIKSKFYDKNDLQVLKEKANKGISEYYSHFKGFLDTIKDNNISLENTLYTQLKRNLKNLDFSNITKREVFDVDIIVHFLNNMDILITRDKNLEIKYSSNLILEGLENSVKKGRDSFLKKYIMLLKNRELFKIDDHFYKNIFFILKELKYNSMVNFRPEFVRDCFYYFGILKNNTQLIKSDFRIKDNIILDTIAVVLGIQNSFRKHFPRENATAYFNLFFTSKFANFAEIKSSTIHKIKKYCQDMIFIFESAQDLKLLRKELKDKFQTNIEFKSIVNNIETLMNKKLNAQKNFGPILGVLKEGIKTKKDSTKNASKIKEILEQKLKGEFSEEQYVESVKSIEMLIKAEMKPIIDYDSILKHLDVSFKKQVTTNNHVNNIIEYINSNLKDEFEDKEKFNSIVNEIREIYDIDFKERKKYSNILSRLKKNLESLDTQKDFHAIQSYIEKKLEDIFDSSKERLSILRQIDSAFFDKTEKPKELEDIIILSSELIIIFINDTVWHNILTASVFTGFLLALNKDKEVSIGSICKILDVLPTSVSLHIKKLLSNYLKNKRTGKFNSLKITDEVTRQNLRLLIVKKLLEPNVYMIFNTKDIKRCIKLIEGFKLRISFFNRYEQFTDSIEEVSKFLTIKYIREFIQEIKTIKDIKERKKKLSDLTFRLKFFKNYELFNDALISLKEDIEGLEFLTPESKEIVLQILSKPNTF